MPTALIVFTSLTGNTEQCADILADALESHGIQVTVEDVMSADVEDYLDYDICIAGSYTYGVDGEIPDEMLDFYEDLLDVDLTGKVFGVFGSGDVFYEVFCGAVDQFEDQFRASGASQGGTSVKVNLNPQGEDITNLQQLAQEIANHF